MKYNIEHFKDFYNNLYKYKKFKKLLLEGFLIYSIPYYSKHLKYIVYNLNNNSNSKVNKTFLKLFTYRVLDIYNYSYS